MVTLTVLNVSEGSRLQIKARGSHKLRQLKKMIASAFSIVDVDSCCLSKQGKMISGKHCAQALISSDEGENNGGAGQASLIRLCSVSSCLGCQGSPGMGERHGVLHLGLAPLVGGVSLPRRSKRLASKPIVAEKGKARRAAAAPAFNAEAAWQHYRAMRLRKIQSELEERWERLSADKHFVELLSWRFDKCSGAAMPAGCEKLRDELDTLITEREAALEGRAGEADAKKEMEEDTQQLGTPMEEEQLSQEQSAWQPHPLLQALHLDKVSLPSPLQVFMTAHGASLATLQAFRRLPETQRCALWDVVAHYAYLQDQSIEAYVSRNGLKVRAATIQPSLFTEFLLQEDPHHNSLVKMTAEICTRDATQEARFLNTMVQVDSSSQRSSAFPWQHPPSIRKPTPAMV